MEVEVRMKAAPGIALMNPKSGWEPVQLFRPSWAPSCNLTVSFRRFPSFQPNSKGFRKEKEQAHIAPVEI